jgi:hypothetical protein
VNHIIAGFWELWPLPNMPQILYQICTQGQ